MKWNLIWLLLSLGCSTPGGNGPRIIRTPAPKSKCTTETTFTFVDERARVFSDDFFQLAREHHVSCLRGKTVTFKPQKEISQDLSSGAGMVVGYCTSAGHIVLSQEIWESSSLLFDKALLFHEMGHCVLNLDHSREGALNLMAPYMLSDEQLAENWDTLMTKLFSKSLSLEDEEDVVFDRHFMPVLR